MTGTTRTMWMVPLAAFVLGSSIGFAGIPVNTLSHEAQTHNIFALVSQLATKNAQLYQDAVAINRSLGHASHKLTQLQTLTRQLSRQEGLNRSVGRTLKGQEELNASLVASQQVLKSRETATLTEQTQVTNSSSMLSTLLDASVAHLQALDHSTGLTDAGLQNLAGLLANVVVALEKVQQGTKIPVVGQSITALTSSTTSLIPSVAPSLSDASISQKPNVVTNALPTAVSNTVKGLTNDLNP